MNDYPHGTAVLSEIQTNARGAKDHKWDASNTGNIYVSFILHLPSGFKVFFKRLNSLSYIQWLTGQYSIISNFSSAIITVRSSKVEW